MKITAKITDKSPSHSRLSVWVNGGLITKPGGICLRNEEVEGFLDHLKIPLEKIKEQLGDLMDHFKALSDQDVNPMSCLDKRIVLQMVLTWIEDHEGGLMVDGSWEVKG